MPLSLAHPENHSVSTWHLSIQDSACIEYNSMSLIWYSHVRKSFFPFLFLFSFHWRSILNNYNTSLGIGVGPASQSWTYVGMIARCVLKHNIMNLTNNCVCLHGFSKLFSVLISRTNHLFIHRIIQIFISPQKC